MMLLEAEAARLVLLDNKTPMPRTRFTRRCTHCRASRPNGPVQKPLWRSPTERHSSPCDFFPVQSAQLTGLSPLPWFHA